MNYFSKFARRGTKVASAAQSISATSPPIVAFSFPGFAPTSFWYKQLSAGQAVHANSVAMVADFRHQISAYFGTVGINTDQYSAPMYFASAAQATRQVFNIGNANDTLSAAWVSVPIPTIAVEATGTDSEMAIYQQSTDTLWEFWLVSHTAHPWCANWGGRMQNCASSTGIWPFPFGAAATGLPFIAGQITAEELKAGVINHVIGIALVELSNQTSSPANRNDGPGNSSSGIREGQQLRFKASVNFDSVSALATLGRAAQIIGKAGQKYGFVIWDKAGAVTLRAVNPLTYTRRGLADPYGDSDAFGSEYPNQLYATATRLPWDQLEFLPYNIN